MRVSCVACAGLLLLSAHQQATAFTSPVFAAKGVSKPSLKEKAAKTLAAKKNKAIPADKNKAVGGDKASFSIPSFGGKKDAPAPAKGKKVAASKGKNKKEVVASKNSLKKDIPKLGDFKAPDLPSIPKVELPALPSLPSISSPVGLAGVAMSPLKGLFAFEAKVQAGVLVGVVDVLGAPLRVYPAEIREEITKRVKSPKPVMYTYGLSPFSIEAKNIVSDYDVEVIELGPEWFLLGPGGSEKRLALAENSKDAQTSLPHLFLKGESLGGLSTGGRNNEGINGLVKSGAIDKILKKKPIVKEKLVAKKKVVIKKSAPAKKPIKKKVVVKKLTKKPIAKKVSKKVSKKK